MLLIRIVLFNTPTLGMKKQAQEFKYTTERGRVCGRNQNLRFPSFRPEVESIHKGPCYPKGGVIGKIKKGRSEEEMML